ncbi:hypothetical protein D915_011086 [Fasciola hepatica]|uniref:Integrase zinc-binding domain-containing protein n=1 Tax=Fasciola hepatica TaxID=6192 RepID=A0A4E0QTC7_FASHE|nr:hypothetical protein D915_011086 [Fasciola hepatica]
METAPCTVAAADMLLRNPEHDEWTKLQSTDPDLRFLYDRLSNQQPRSSEDVQGTSYNVRCLWALWPHLRVVDGILVYQNGPDYLHRMVVPAMAIETFLRRLHEELGHAGQNKLEDSTRRCFRWTYLKCDFANFCNACTECSQI